MSKGLKKTLFASEQVTVQSGKPDDPFIFFSPQISSDEFSPEEVLEIIQGYVDRTEGYLLFDDAKVSDDLILENSTDREQLAANQLMNAIRDVALASGFSDEDSARFVIARSTPLTNTKLHLDMISDDLEKVARFNFAFGPGTEIHPTHRDEGYFVAGYSENSETGEVLGIMYQDGDVIEGHPGKFSDIAPGLNSGHVQARPGYVAAFDLTAGRKENDDKKAWHKAPAQAIGTTGRGYLSVTVSR